MKHLFLLLPLTLLSVPVHAQPVTCTQYTQVYVPGVYDSYGNYIPGGVRTQCTAYQSYYPYQAYQPYQPYGRRTNPNCNPTRTLLGAVLGGSIGRAAAMNYPKNYGWATALGASVGGLTFAC